MRPDSTLGFVVRRLGLAALTLVALSGVIFTATEILPGDPAAVVAGPDATPEQRDRVRTSLGLDRPAPERYLEWVGGALRADLGQAFIGGRPVTDVVARRLPNSLILGGLALSLAIPVGTLIGAMAGSRPGGTRDRLLSTASLLAVGIPEFVTAGLLLAVLGLWLSLVPTVSVMPLGGGPLDTPSILLLPALSLAVLPGAAVARLVRAAVADTMASAPVEAARLNGVSGLRLLCHHVLPTCLGPTVQLLGLAVGALVGGAIVVEELFAYPGIGAELQGAVANKDLPMIQGLALVLAALTLLGLLTGDLLARLLDPRVREIR